MKAWIIPAGCTAGPGGLRLVEQPSPQPGPGQVKLRLHAWSTNYRDLAITLGRYPRGTSPRDTVALSDGAGEVVAVGDGVTRWQPGDRVAANFFQDWQAGPMRPQAFASALGGAIDGMLAEEVVLGESGLVRIPDHLSFAQAATLPCAAVTAWNALFEVGGLRPGRSVLVMGSGGVSVFALQLARAAGARVIATSSSEDKMQRLAGLGADAVINYRTRPDWDQAVLEHTGGAGVDLVVEVGGAGTLPRSLNAVGLGGTVALIGVLAGVGAQIDPSPLLMKSARLQGVFVGSTAMFEVLAAALAAGHIEPVIDRRFAFDQAPEAYAWQASGQHFGKVVIGR
jgi:NADPH:quinone reductase-like Zn-dependent oxidoreductase